MLPAFCPPTIWAISLEFYRKLSILAADDFLGACYRKAMTPKELWTLLFPHIREALVTHFLGIAPLKPIPYGPFPREIILRMDCG